VIPGELILGTEPIAVAPHRERRQLRVLNTGDRPVQVGSHFHFADVNSALSFDRAEAVGFRLDVPAGTSVQSIDELRQDRGRGPGSVFGRERARRLRAVAATRPAG
jgi:urease subunit beta